MIMRKIRNEGTKGEEKFKEMRGRMDKSEKIEKERMIMRR